MTKEGRVHPPGKGRDGRCALVEPAPDIESIGAKILALAAGTPGPSPTLWRKSELARAISVGERPLLGAALARLEERRELLRVPDGSRGERFLFAGALRRWLGVAETAPPRLPADSPEPTGALDADTQLSTLLTAYARAVRESGGFPDVKVSALRRALPALIAKNLPETLRALWREGRVTLSLGDWSLASEETRQAAVELDGERYLLVRFEKDPADDEFTE